MCWGLEAKFWVIFDIFLVDFVVEGLDRINGVVVSLGISVGEPLLQKNMGPIAEVYPLFP